MGKTSSGVVRCRDLERALLLVADGLHLEGVEEFGEFLGVRTALARIDLSTEHRRCRVGVGHVPALRVEP